eukprot:TRINITY_DN6718_c0_g1_i1.p1 TRINITY_DN6718_c0_g1~~TRINITY_DN6718_c0_g1_i1.p1  ORF type:complete len:415 (+),score=98.80 TRINITY_DN6718_c0_g1_i1:65-1309(+)
MDRVRVMESHVVNTPPPSPSPCATPAVTVCGAGNAAHVMVSHLSSLGCDVRWLAPFGNEQESLVEGLKKHGGILMNGKVGKPRVVTKSAMEAIPGSKFVFIPLPVFAHEATLRAVVPFCEEDCVIVVLPATGAFDWTAEKVFKDLNKRVDVAGVGPLPYVCRTRKFGEEVNLLGVKSRVGMACTKGADAKAIAGQIENMLGFQVVVFPSFLSITLTPTNPIMHPGRMYGMLVAKKYWRESTPPLTKNVLFYDECDEVSSQWIHRLDNENQMIVKKLEELLPGCIKDSVLPVNQYLKWAYGSSITDHSSAGACYRTNKQFHGVASPLLEVAPGYWVPNFKSRYFTEDIPFGLLTNKGIAELIGVPTPSMDCVIEWAQHEMGKKWIVDHKINPDETPQQTPQALGMTFQSFIAMYS